MRQWLVDPKVLCQKHLLGEHVEHHMFVGSINKGIDASGYITTGLLDISKLQSRHAELVEEMLRRGMNHKSPLDPLDPAQVAKYEFIRPTIDIDANYRELHRRCELCRANIDDPARRSPERGGCVPSGTPESTSSR